MEGNIRIYRLLKGRGMDQWKWYCPNRRRVQCLSNWSVPRPKGSLSILILHSVSVTIVFIALKTRIWHLQYTIVTDTECNIRIDRLPLGRGTNQWKWYCPRLRIGKYHFHWSVPRSLSSLYVSWYICITLHISNYYIIGILSTGSDQSDIAVRQIERHLFPVQ